MQLSSDLHFSGAAFKVTGGVVLGASHLRKVSVLSHLDSRILQSRGP